MAVKWISRLDKAIRASGKKPSLFVKIVINDFNTGKHDILTPLQMTTVELMIREKRVDPLLFAQCYFGVKSDNRNRRYNISTGSVWRCLSKTQWRELENYYRSMVKVEE